ncbi:voltage-dependent calcium channel gamma-6 subunit [Xiphophorus maculatus]|uniref:Calcium voltage-gated channel auxiliary subunit gamma 6 n=1 Tax=Xiphophorus maculatus TaxID=8083 RepID=M4AC20_XIPMA|nr:voltage-dependent calcium channel gamma-6 subunit [Xiphophorus maculatus]XP_023187037.1 voltage-dependent calcium channel gamma-6 subunit [Xiphophorus maculatus]XP_023187038.1 voltage-dependent calcium channel gamma-6 subunit [Xiphophorus maculatus]XP_032415208.1 voltage-dependent calcium channel gamma-6 subunit [Xiphophorus hellerii]XP_032415209.1 voltage-dependent calcium channel gamma-6 subunit [Xiphophorus hellerii]XP_032415210.1 voltage-dependent calcium channel gamma-6 subunit [Xiphop
MWSNFFVQQEEEGRMGVAGGGQGGGLAGMKGFRGGQRRTNKMSDSQEGKIKLVFFVAIVGVTLTVLGMGTEFWVELAQPKNYSGNQTCQMAHYGLWKGCIRTLWVADIDPERTSCGPAELPGESNCTYFKFFTSGENAVIFKKTTNRNLNLAAAILALLSLTMMVMGSICIAMSLNKGVPFFLKPASFCFILSGVLVLLSVLIFHQSVLALLSSDHSIPLHHELSWSVACVGSAGAILIIGGVLFIFLALPFSPWQKCFPHKDSTT